MAVRVACLCASVLPALPGAPGRAHAALTVRTDATGELDADYTTTKLFIDEVAGDSVDLVVEYLPNLPGVTAAEVVTNLNRRARAALDADGDGVHDGILRPPLDVVSAGADTHYYAAVPMAPTGGGRFSATVAADRTGAYRLTARFKTSDAVPENDNDPSKWIYYGYNGRRDHAVVVSPITARDVRMYELNVLNIEAEGTLESQRSTFVDLHDGPGSKAFQRWNLDYADELGVNWLWFQPVHPYGVDGRHLSAADINARSPGSGATTWRWNLGSPLEDVNYPYDLGSPYAVKNFFEIAPQMSKANTRAAALAEFQGFVAAADAAGISIMLDAAFNHTAWDCEAAAPGVALGFGPAPDSEIRDHEARFFSRTDAYDERASSAGSIAPAPDRYDFGKWLDARDVYFGRYDALVADAGDAGGHLGEGDWFDTSVATGSFDAITQSVWRYFAGYVLHWLDQTGHPAGTPPASHPNGIDGLRCDFGQGLPPQAWEYIVNVARARKWSFLFMAESLDGGPVTYRSNRHFDILNENILFALQSVGGVNDYRDIFEERRASYGAGLVLLNTVSHDEQNYADPWQALIRYAVGSTIEGAPMIFSGQEQGLADFFGFDLMEKNFGKYVPHFKTYNSMMPLWTDADFGNAQLLPVYSAINRARAASPALRSPNRFFLNLLGGGVHDEVWGVAKYQEAGASPAFSDVVFAFVNTDRDNDRPGFPGESTVFDVSALDGASGSNLFGIDPGRTYNVRNLAAYTAQDPNRADAWLWGAGRGGAGILIDGILAELNRVPVSEAAWSSDPYEPLFLRLHDVTPPPPPQPRPARHYAIGTEAAFTLVDSAGPHDNIVAYRVHVGTSPGGSDVADDLVIPRSQAPGDDSFVVSGAVGDVLYVTVVAVSAAGIESTVPAASDPGPPAAGVADSAVALLDALADSDGDGSANGDERVAGTDPLDPASVFRVISIEKLAGGAVRLRFSSDAEPRLYTVQGGAGLSAWIDEDEAGAVNFPAAGPVTEFVDFNPGALRKFYRVLVSEP